MEQAGDMEGIQAGKEVTAPAFGDNPIIDVENPMKSTKTLPELIIESSQVAGCKSNTATRQHQLGFCIPETNNWELK